jgi:hypothetical protein
MKKVLSPITFVFLLISNMLYSGIPVNTVNAGIFTSTSEIVVGQEVIFSFGGQDNCDLPFALIYNFGPNANPHEEIEVVQAFNMSSSQFAVVFNTPGPVNVTLNISQTDCNIAGFPFTLPLEISPAPIPTLSQWALLILAFSLMVFAVLKIRDQTKTVCSQ